MTEAAEVIRDADLEARIRGAMNEYFSTVGQPDTARIAAWAKVVKLIGERTPKRVASMESALGLNR